MADEPVQAERGPQDEQRVRLPGLEDEQALDGGEKEESGDEAGAPAPEPPAEVVDTERADEGGEEARQPEGHAGGAVT